MVKSLLVTLFLKIMRRSYVVYKITLFVGSQALLLTVSLSWNCLKKNLRNILGKLFVHASHLPNNGERTKFINSSQQICLLATKKSLCWWMVQGTASRSKRVLSPSAQEDFMHKLLPRHCLTSKECQLNRLLAKL